MTWTDEHTQPLSAGTGRHGVLLLHDFSGTPATMRPWAEHLVERSYRVSVPLLSGHGTRWQELARTRWTDWYRDAEQAFLGLQRECDTVSVAGLSLGAALALRVGENHRDAVTALVLVNPSLTTDNKFVHALPLMQHIVRSVGNDGRQVKNPIAERFRYDRLPLPAVLSMTRMWGDVRRRIGDVTAPVLLFRSTADGTVGERSSTIVLRGVSSAERQEILLHDSYHIATLDNDAPLIFAESAAFLAARLKR